MKKFFQKLFGYCRQCKRYFVYPKRRRMNTMYVNEEDNYICVCKDCFKDIEDYWDQCWEDYFRSVGR